MKHFLAWTMVATLIALGLSQAGENWESRITDSWYRDGRRQVKLDPKIVLVLIDDASLEKLKTPLTFWAPHFAQALAGLMDGEAAAVGLDWLPYDIDSSVFERLTPAFPELGEIHDNPWVPLLEALDRHPGHVVCGIYPPNFQNSLPVGGLKDHYRPAVELMTLAGPNQLGFLNLSRDSDGILRSQTVLPLKLREALWGADSYPPFSARLAEVATAQELHPDHPTWNGKPLKLTPDGALCVNFAPPGVHFPRYSFAEVLDWCKKDPARVKKEFAGKIAMIGPGIPLFQDMVQTPVGSMLGVESHGFCINTLLTEQFLTSADPSTGVFLTTGAAALGVASGLLWVPALGLLAALALGAGYYFLLNSWFCSAGWLGPVLSPLLGLGAGWALGAAWRAHRMADQQRYIRQLFGRYVSPQVMEVLLKDPNHTALGAVAKRHITVLFSDINGFSTHCEKKTPELIMEMLNRYFDCMNRIIFRHQGSIKQFVGDEIMAMYGAPLNHPKAEEAAVLSAVEMIRELEKQRREDPKEERGFYLIKVGIHSGDVILGNVGSFERTEYAAVGDDVNLGARLMSMTKALEADILISREVYEKVQHLPGMKFISKGSHPVKGRVEPIEIYAVIPEELS